MFRPTDVFDHLWDISPDYIQKNHIRAFFLDVDNTLTAHNSQTVLPQVRQWLDERKKEGVLLILLSNNTPERVAPFAAALGVDFVTGTKPRRDIYEAALKKAGVPREAAAAVGDQFFTDVWGASRARIRCLLTRPLSRDTNRFIRFKRVLEKPLWRLYAKEKTQ